MHRVFKCKIDPNNFCFVCGNYIFNKKGRLMNEHIKYAYLHYFGFGVNEEPNSWTPNVICDRCRKILTSWLSGEKVRMPFGVPVIWRQQKDHVSDCYFCLTDLGVGIKK